METKKCKKCGNEFQAEPGQSQRIHCLCCEYQAYQQSLLEERQQQAQQLNRQQIVDG